MSVIDCDWIGSALKQRAELQTSAQFASGRLARKLRSRSMRSAQLRAAVLTHRILAPVVERSVRPSPRLDRLVPLFRTMAQMS
jgi:hypothetical protein